MGGWSQGSPAIGQGFGLYRSATIAHAPLAHGDAPGAYLSMLVVLPYHTSRRRIWAQKPVRAVVTADNHAAAGQRTAPNFSVGAADTVDRDAETVVVEGMMVGPGGRRVEPD